MLRALTQQLQLSGKIAMLINTDRSDGSVDAALKQGGVVARAYGIDGIRITVGSPEMNDRFLRAIADVAPVG